MKNTEVKELVDKIKENDYIRVTIPYDQQVLENLRKDYLCVIEDSPWNSVEIVITDKL